MIQLTRYEPKLAGELRRVFHSAIHISAAPWYSERERQVWSPERYDQAGWSAKLAEIEPWVAWDGDQVIGYADVQPTGYIDHFYVSGYAARRGVGTVLFDHLISEAQRLGVEQLSSDVSLSAEGFFERQGFRVRWRRTLKREGVALRNARMTRRLHL